jgi:hypothetical protein
VTPPASSERMRMTISAIDSLPPSLIDFDDDLHASTHDALLVARFGGPAPKAALRATRRSAAAPRAARPG